MVANISTFYGLLFTFIGYFYGEGELAIEKCAYDKAVITVAAEIVELPQDIRRGVYTLTKIINHHHKKEKRKIA